MKPCPHCGSKEIDGPHLIGYVEDRYRPHWWLKCQRCPAAMEIGGATADELMAAWNKRAPVEDQ